MHRARSGAEVRRSDAILAAALALAFAPALLALVRVWSSLDYYSHGFLVPVISFWVARDRWRRGFLRAPEPRGRIALAAALGLYAVGVGAGLVSVQGVALVAALAGFVWSVWGVAALGALAFPIAFLLFMVPIPPAVLTPRIVDLQLLVSSAAVAVLRGFDVPLAREGNVLLLGSGEALFVEEACSGITSIVTLLPVAALLVFLVRASARGALGLMLAVIPVAMFWNLVRVLGTVAATRSVGVVKATTGSLHDTAGMLTFVLGCLTLLALSALLGSRSESDSAGD